MEWFGHETPPHTCGVREVDERPFCAPCQKLRGKYPGLSYRKNPPSSQFGDSDKRTGTGIEACISSLHFRVRFMHKKRWRTRSLVCIDQKMGEIRNSRKVRDPRRIIDYCVLNGSS